MYHNFYPSNTTRGGTFVIIKDSIQQIEDINIELETIQLITMHVQIKNIRK